jgi:hypothetical protein
VIRCAACRKRILPREPDLMLEDLATGKRRYYHNRRQEAAYEHVIERPAPYHLMIRHVEAGAN